MVDGLLDLTAFLKLTELLSGKRFAVLTGAGVSTDSGIPDYRSPGRPKPNPIQHRQFVADAAWRQRYWARSLIGWERLRSALPNESHRALAKLEMAGQLTGLITQNVDRLHQLAGSRRIIELHGALAEVRCLNCEGFESREVLQLRLRALNPGFESDLAGGMPDGDAEVSPVRLEGFCVAPCVSCGGTLMPNVVFFGGTVAPSVVADAMACVDRAGALLVLGSSLTVFSGYRFVRRAVERGIPIAIVSLGPTRGDPEATLKLEAPLAEVVPRLAARLCRA